MGFLDKVKVQAEKAKGQAQDLKGKVGDKVEEVQGKRKADELLSELGRFVYAEQTGRPLPAADSEVSRIVNDLKALEADGTTVLPTTTPVPPATADAPAAPAADDAPAASEAPVTVPDAYAEASSQPESATSSATALPPDLPV